MTNTGGLRLLGQSARALGSIGDEFEHAARIKDEVVGHVGSAEIAKAMGDFTDNWDHKRQDLTENIKATKDAVNSVMASFSAQDKAAARFDLSHQAAPVTTTPGTGP